MAAVLAAVGLPALSGCGGAEGGPPSAQAGSGLIDGILQALKREDDAADVKELRKHEPTKEEREEAREQVEQANLEQAQQEQTQGQEPDEGF